ncbi:MAG: formate--tetrahydrofolate ligase, partial [Erysipelotrichaceae bacterium]
INEFVSDTQAEVEALENWCKENHHPMALSQVWAKGGDGGIELANEVVKLCDQTNDFAPIYDVMDSIENKVNKIAKIAYGAKEVVFSETALKQIKVYEELGWNHTPICMAKTPTSLTDQDKIYGAPKDFTINVREFRPSLGAGFIVALTGNVMTMPGLPKAPAALNMDIDEEGHIEGLF